MTRKNLWLTLAGAAALAALGAFFYEQFHWESTDDAYVGAHYLMLAPRVGGTVSRVLIHENERVRAGQVLVLFDGNDYRTARDQAAADVASLGADAAQARLDYARDTRLLAEGVVTRQAYDRARARSRGLDARLAAAQFRLRQAQLNLGYTTLTAPEDGFIAKRAVEPGMVVPAGQPLIGFVSAGKRWVTANYKETQLPDIRPGEEAEVEVDALPGRTFRGTVESIGSATGSTFTLLPPDNSTGNFTKVVQRVPVRIALPGLDPEDAELLRVGLSADVSVKVR